MEVLIVLLVSLVVLRGVGFVGIKRLASLRNAGVGALAVMFLVTSTAHFTGRKYDLAAMMLEPLPDGLWIIYLTGAFEIAGAIGLLIPRTRRLAGICLVLLLIAVFPANVNAALNGIRGAFHRRLDSPSGCPGSLPVDPSFLVAIQVHGERRE